MIDQVVEQMVVSESTRRLAADAAAAAGVQGEAQRRVVVERVARQVVADLGADMARRGEVVLSEQDEEALVRSVLATQLGLGRLQFLLDDDAIENIDCNGFDTVWVEYGDGTRQLVDPVADSDSDLVALCQRAARLHHVGGERRLDVARPYVDLRLPGGHRMSVLIDVGARPYVSIRRHRMMDVSLADLSSMMTDELRELLAASVRAGCNIVVSGSGTNAGKTTFLRALLAECDPQTAIITIELAFELGLHELGWRHSNVRAWEVREANTEGAGAIGMDVLVERALRHHPDRIVVGEVLGDEVVQMLNAMSSGHSGGLCTLHANSAQDTFSRLGLLASQAPKQMSEQAVAKLIGAAVELVVFVGFDGGSSRRVVREVRAVEGAQGTQVISTELYAQPAGGGLAEARFAPPTALRERLVAVGYEPPARLWGMA